MTFKQSLWIPFTSHLPWHSKEQSLPFSTLRLLCNVRTVFLNITAIQWRMSKNSLKWEPETSRHHIKISQWPVSFLISVPKLFYNWAYVTPLPLRKESFVLTKKTFASRHIYNYVKVIIFYPIYTLDKQSAIRLSFLDKS